MTSSGLYNFDPSAAEFVLNAYSRIGLRREQLTAQHLSDAALECNLINTSWSNRGPNLWKTELITQALTEGTATYVLPRRIINFMAVYLTVDQGSGSTYDRILSPLSTFDYASIPNKTTQAPSTSYWWERVPTSQITMWPVPDDTATYTLNLQAIVQIEDVSLPSGTTLNLPFRWLDAFTASLAHRLARIYRPDMEAIRKADADEAWTIAATEDIEYTPMWILPGLARYTNT